MARWMQALLLIALLLHGQAWTRSACECRYGVECGSPECPACSHRGASSPHAKSSCCHQDSSGESDEPTDKPCDCGRCGRVNAGPFLGQSDAADVAHAGRAVAAGDDLPATSPACTLPASVAVRENWARGLHGPPGSPSSATPDLLPVLRF